MWKIPMATFSASVVARPQTEWRTASDAQHARALQIMFKHSLSILFILASGVASVAQTKSYVAPHNGARARIVAVGPESRVDIGSSAGSLLRRKDFTSRDQNHGEVVTHAEWTRDGRFFVFTTGSSGGHQPWHVATYFYSLSRNRFYSVDAIVGPILSDFALHGDVLSTTRMGINADDPKPVTLSLNRWR
jgi:hypothetical protein